MAVPPDSFAAHSNMFSSSLVPAKQVVLSVSLQVPTILHACMNLEMPVFHVSEFANVYRELISTKTVEQVPYSTTNVVTWTGIQNIAAKLQVSNLTRL